MLRFVAVGVFAFCIIRASCTKLNKLAIAVVFRGNAVRVSRPLLAVSAVLNRKTVSELIFRRCGSGGIRIAVVLLLKIIESPHNTVLVDLAALNLEPAVLNHELDVGEVIAGVGELLLG